jgi:lantibiotic modifying enzyme
MTTDEVYQVLCEPVAAMAQRSPTPPTWITAIVHAFTHLDDLTASPLPPPEQRTADDQVGWLSLVEPLIRDGCTRLRASVASVLSSCDPLPFDPETVVPICLPGLLPHLETLLARTLSLELNVTRLQHGFPDTTPQARVQSFVDHIRQPHVALALLQDYPVLARQVMICIDTWVTTSQEFLTHLCADWFLIQATFAAGQPLGNLVRLDRDQGDRHRGGRTVLIATFAGGLMLVYKPRSLAVDSHFQRLLRWLNARDVQPPFRTLRVLDRGTYGWVEYIRAKPCESAAAVERFYRRQGGYLALLAVLGATDVHCDNVIAAGEHPMLIDLETLLHVAPTLAEPGSVPPDQARDADAVLQIGLLPTRIPGRADEPGSDMSGLGGGNDQCKPLSPGGKNRPVLHGVALTAGDYADAIVAGFTAMYRMLLARRPAFLAPDGPLAPFANVAVRTIVRPTWFYDALLNEALHPDLLRSGLSRDRFFDHLWTSAPNTPHMAQVIAAERADLQRGDIPFFQTHPTTRNVWTGDGQRIAGLLHETGMNQMQRRIARLSPDDMTRQIGCIYAALNACYPTSR